MNIIIPLAGKDSRFEEKNIFKAFVEVEGKPLIKFCIDTLPWPFQEENVNLIFIILREHDKKYNVSNKLKELYPDSKIIYLDEETEGAACTALLAKDLINNDDELVIYLADIYFKGDIKTSIKTKKNVEGFIPCFKSNKDKYSYAKLNEDGTVKEVAEKSVISDNASAGFYYFRHGKSFVKAAENMIKDPNKKAGMHGAKKWFFICPVYNDLIELGEKVEIIPVKFEFDLGDDEFIGKYLP
ncbi:MAG: sugar phosphate nucleotidyltransferase [Candidatus Nanoarchaeia archaeon]